MTEAAQPAPDSRAPNPVGRPPTDWETVLPKLEAAFLMGCTDAEACIFANVAPTQFYNYQADHPEFKERKDLLKQNLKLQARTNVAAKITAGDIELSQWYLERKAKDEFSTRVENLNTNYEGMSLIREEEIEGVEPIQSKTENSSTGESLVGNDPASQE